MKLFHPCHIQTNKRTYKERELGPETPFWAVLEHISFVTEVFAFGMGGNICCPQK